LEEPHPSSLWLYLLNFNIGGWLFAVPKLKLAQFPDSVLWKKASETMLSVNQQLFIDRDGFIFKYVHAYLLTKQLPIISSTEVNLLHEQAQSLHLAPLQQILENLKDGDHHLNMKFSDVIVAESTSLNLWKFGKCNSKQLSSSPKSPLFPDRNDRAPLGLLDKPLLDSESEVPYCFLPLELVMKYPSLVTEKSLLWMTEIMVLIKCRRNEFRFLANFFRSERILLPSHFKNMPALEAEVRTLNFPELSEAMKLYKMTMGMYTKEIKHGTDSASKEPLFKMTLALLVKYPDSALGQLHIEGNLDGSKLFIDGNGILFEHVRNWLGISRIPLTGSITELPHLCSFLETENILYGHVKMALKSYLESKIEPHSKEIRETWKAEITVYSIHQIVNVYVGNYWYATSLQTLLKYPEMLTNSQKVHWIMFGKSLFIHGDGLIFRHILNFLRLDKLLLPPKFREWPLFCQEVKEFKITALMDAMAKFEDQRHSRPGAGLMSRAGKRSRRIRMDVCSPFQPISGVPVDLPGTFSTSFSQKAVIPREDEPSASSISVDLTRTYSFGLYPPYSRPGAAPQGWLRLAPPLKDYTRSNAPQGCPDQVVFTTPMQKVITLIRDRGMANNEQWNLQRLIIPVKSASAGVTMNLTPTPGVAYQPNLTIIPWTVQPATPEMPAPLFKPGFQVNGLEQKFNLKFPGTRSISLTSLGRQEPFEKSEYSLQAVPPAAGLKLGTILKVSHPPIMGNDGHPTDYQESIIYTLELAHRTWFLSAEALFLNLSLSREEIFYARMCHHFLTDIILESIRKRDPIIITTKVVVLTHQVWTLDITTKQFVTNLLTIPGFQNDKNTQEHLHKWVELTLPLAQKYSRCIHLLIKKGLAHIVSHTTFSKDLPEI
uniref:Potassium channel tetramerisation-type BTB domain-containing protein n=1 Tax=Ornithorhynchus anatinus TaxID=9258 RepID=A0A6I8PQQ1_ORNAN